jgi:SH3-like domain-containing protein
MIALRAVSIQAVLLRIKSNAAPLCAAFSFALFIVLPTQTLAQTPPAPAAVPTPKPTPVPGLSAPLQVSPPPATPSANYAAISDKPAIVFDAPSAKAQKIFVFSRNMPVEVLVKLDKWVKVRDADNTVGWIDASALGTQRFVQVNTDAAQIRDNANASANVIFEARRAVLLEVTGAANLQGFLPVRHRDGQSGFVLKSQIWGD